MLRCIYTQENFPRNGKFSVDRMRSTIFLKKKSYCACGPRKIFRSVGNFLKCICTFICSTFTWTKGISSVSNCRGGSRGSALFGWFIACLTRPRYDVTYPLELNGVANIYNPYRIRKELGKAWSPINVARLRKLKIALVAIDVNVNFNQWNVFLS